MPIVVRIGAPGQLFFSHWGRLRNTPEPMLVTGGFVGYEWTAAQHADAMGEYWRTLAELQPGVADRCVMVAEDLMRTRRAPAGLWDHHHGERGAPYFSDGTCLMYTARAWADLMALVHDQGRFRYVDFL